MSETLESGKKVLLCGNGGSAADAQHLAAEFLVRLRPNVNRKSYPVISLAQDISTITACGNDLGFENIFSRQIEALGKPGDVAIGISTSGNSENVVRALEVSKQMNITPAAFGGKDGGKIFGLADPYLIVPSNTTARIQEIHLLAIHCICDGIDLSLLGEEENES